MIVSSRANPRAVLIFASVALCCAGAGAASVGRSPEGRWITDDGKAVVAITQCGNTLCGRIDAILDKGPHPTVDLHNPDERLRHRPLIGLTILTGFGESGNGWAGGHAYDPKNGRTYRASLKVPDAQRLILTGCVLVICRSQYWSRAR